MDIVISTQAIADKAWDGWYDRHSGPLRQSVQAVTPVDKGGLKGGVEVIKGFDHTAKVRTRTRYAMFVIRGHGTIYPKKPGGVLTWLDKLTGKRVYAKKVRPVAANNFLAKGCRNYGLRVVEH